MHLHVRFLTKDLVVIKSGRSEGRPEAYFSYFFPPSLSVSMALFSPYEVAFVVSRHWETGSPPDGTQGKINLGDVHFISGPMSF